MKKILILTIAILSAAFARADVITETVNFGTITGDKTHSFSQFDTSLGMLTGVTLSWTINSNISSAAITNRTPGTVTVTQVSFMNAVEGSIFEDRVLTTAVSKNTSHIPADGDVAVTSGQTYDIGSVAFTGFTQEDTYTASDANFGRFKGTGEVPVYLANAFGATPTASGGMTDWLTNMAGSSTGSLQVTYNYTAMIAPVPEPSGLMLGGGGLLFLGAFAFKTRRSALTDSAVAA